MAVQRLLTPTDSPEIVIHHAEGDLVVRGWNQNELLIRADDNEMELVQHEGGAALKLEGDAQVTVPANSRLMIHTVEGDLQVASVMGAVHVRDVQGDLNVRDCGPLHIESVQGDCNVRMVNGDCIVQSIESDASFSGIAGNLTVENVADDLNVSNVRGSVRVSAADDISLRLIVQPGFTYSARAGSDLVCRIQSDAAVLVDLSAGEDLHVRRLALPEPLKGKHARFALNGGEGATLTLVAGNDLSLVGLSIEELGDLGADLSFDIGLRAAEFVQQFASQFEAQVGAIAKQMDEKITNLGNTEEVATRIQERILAAARKAEEKITEAMKRMETRQREADKRQASAPWAGGWNASWTAAPSTLKPMRPPEPPAPPAPPAPSAPPVSEQERMSVLKMVSEGKISVEQAEKLLAALNGTTSGPGSSDR